MRRGEIIALIGADGAGKSTVAAALCRALGEAATSVYMGSNPTAATHALPTTRLLWAAKRALGVDLHHSGPPDPQSVRRRPGAISRRAVAHLKSLVLLAPRVPEEMYRAFVAGRLCRRGQTVFVDRHPVPDYFGRDVLGTRGWLRAGDRVHGWLVRQWYPRPDRILMLDAPSQLLWERKPEGSYAALEARCVEYRAFAEAHGAVVVIDASQPLQEVVDEALGHLVGGRGAEMTRESQLASATTMDASSAAARRTRPARRATRALRKARARFYYRALDAMYMAPHCADSPSAALASRTNNFERVARRTRAIRERAPRLMERVARWLASSKGLPFAGADVRPIGYGSGSTCLRLEGPPPTAIKVIRISLGLDVEDLLQLGREILADYATLRRWYADVPGLLAPTAHVILRGPVRGARALARIQPFVQGETTDLFADHTDEQLVALLEKHDELRDAFSAFVRATRRSWDEEGRVLDLLGHENIMLLDPSGRPHLYVIDFGIMDLRVQRRERPEVYARFAAALERLERIAAGLDDASEAGGAERASRPRRVE